MDSCIIFNQMKHQPQLLLQRKAQLLKQSEQIKKEITLIDENVETTNLYLEN